MNARLVPPPRRPQEWLAGVGITGLAGAGLAGLYQLTGLGLICPFHYLTGLDCPMCGGTRMGAALLRGDLAGAWRANAVLLLAAVLVGVRSVGWLVEWVRGPAAYRRWAPAWLARRGVWIWGGVGAAWWIARNIWWPV